MKVLVGCVGVVMWRLMGNWWALVGREPEGVYFIYQVYVN